MWLIVVALVCVAVAWLARAACTRGAVASLAGERLVSLESLPEECPLEASRAVVIQKSDRALGLYVDGQLVGAYRIGLGGNPEGHKGREGDGRTPEGTYFICTRNAQSRFHLFLGISYPGPDDAARAAADNMITPDQSRAIIEAGRDSRQPPWDTPLGGEVGLHGGGGGWDWTLGCIAMDDEAIESLWDVLKIGDPVLILP